MADETAAIRQIVARSFALIAAAAHEPVDLTDHVEIANRLAGWVLGEDEVLFECEAHIENDVEFWFQSARKNLKNKGSAI